MNEQNAGVAREIVDQWLRGTNRSRADIIQRITAALDGKDAEIERLRTLAEKNNADAKRYLDALTFDCASAVLTAEQVAQWKQRAEAAERLAVELRAEVLEVLGPFDRAADCDYVRNNGGANELIFNAPTAKIDLTDLRRAAALCERLRFSAFAQPAPGREEGR